jgi:Rrf2 family protein
MLSQRAKYAIRALLMLADCPDGELIFNGEIAARENVPAKFLSAILLDLRNHGLVESRRGKFGGYRLAKSATQISCGEVIRLVDGSLAPLPCASETKFRRCEDCRDPETCSVRWLMLKVRDATASVLDNCTLAQVLYHRHARNGFVPDFEI